MDYSGQILESTTLVWSGKRPRSTEHGLFLAATASVVPTVPPNGSLSNTLDHSRAALVRLPPSRPGSPTTLS